MHNKVVFRAAKAAVNVGVPALRFNFRGVGQSEGMFAHGTGERDDARAAINYLETRFPSTPVCMMGFSFGSVVGVSVGATDARVYFLVAMGLPVASSDLSFLQGIQKPKLIVQGTRDEFGPRAQLETFFTSLEQPKKLHWVEGADHFFTGRLAELESVIQEFLRGILGHLKQQQ
jgi:alpha/beta superfamily hydrolase